MAAIFLLVFLLVTIPTQRILGFSCSGVVHHRIMNCDHCIKCGGDWCINPKENESHCTLLNSDGGSCSSPDSEVIPSFPDISDNSALIRHSYDVKSIGVLEDRQIEFETAAAKIEHLVMKLPENGLPKVKWLPNEECSDRKKNRCFNVKLDKNFCSDTGGQIQHFNISLKIGNVEHAKVKFNVPCACECTKKASINDQKCSGRGNLTCGVCICDDKWEGKNCELEKPYDETEYEEPPYTGDCAKRGDANCLHDSRQDVECSGNGKCDDCCICDRTKVGWQYFNQEKYCEDLCMTTADFLKTDLNSPSIRFIQYNETVTNRTDSKGRIIWVKCNETIKELVWEFYARKNGKGEIGVMIRRKISPEALANETGGGVYVTALVVPLVVVAALVAAAVAYYVFKGTGAAPQPSRANYQGLDGPKTRVETNPVYIEPIKSYKNPTYGQNT